jgi:hypothetical protein
MCDPVSLAIGTTVAGGAIGVVGQLKAGAQEQKTSYENAQSLYDRTREVDEKAKYDIDQLKRNFERKQGNNIARVGGENLNLATFADVLADDALESYLERKAVRISADSEIRNLNDQAGQQISVGKNARKSSYLNAAGTAVSTVGKGVQLYSQFEATRPANYDPTWGTSLK